MKTIIILRGLPGSGKSTLISHLEKEYGKQAKVCSADHYFYFGKEHIPENYKFDRFLLGKAHGSCKWNCKKAMEDGEELIIIDNTNIRLTEYKLYALLGLEHGYKVVSHAIVGMSAEKSAELNVHNVPLETCVRMLSNYEKMPRKILGQDNKVVEVEEIKHDYQWIRKGVYGNGKFGNKKGK